MKYFESIRLSTVVTTAERHGNCKVQICKYACVCAMIAMLAYAETFELINICSKSIYAQETM